MGTTRVCHTPHVQWRDSSWLGRISCPATQPETRAALAQDPTPAEKRLSFEGNAIMIHVEGKDKMICRLQSADGHLGSIIKMVENDRPAQDVLKQLSAVQAALNKINILVYNQEIESF